MANSVLAKMAVQISANTAEFNRALATTNSQLTSFGKNIQAVGNSIGASLGAATIYQGIKYGIGIIADFEASMSEVKAITGATGKEFESLTQDALKLGAATKFTAKEVSQLQVAYGRLGFTTKEILNATKATLDLAAATGENLAKSADIAGSVVRAFNLDASETLRVADVMASSFNKSALGLDNFGEAMKYVAPVAANANLSLEQTTALLGVLADAGIRGSMAGTSLRKIISDLGQGAGPILTKRLKELAAAGISGAEAMDEVGRTAYASLLILANNTEKVDAATEAYKNATGEVAKMAAVMQDNLTGDVTKLTSAFEGLILKGSGVTGFIREMTQGITAFISTIQEAPSISDAWGLTYLVATSGPAGLKILKEYREVLAKVDAAREKQKQKIDKRDSMIPQGGVDPISGLPLEGGTKVPEFKNILDEIGLSADKTKNKIDGLNQSVVKMREYLTKDFSVSDDFKKIGEAFKEFSEAKFGKFNEIKMPDFDQFMSKFKGISRPIQQFSKDVKEAFIDLAPVLTDFASMVGEFFADLNNGVGEMLPIGERFKALIGGLMQSIGGALIAIGIGKIAIKLPGPQAIAAGLALVAAGAALSKSVANTKKALNGGGGGASGSDDSIGRAADNVRPQKIQVEVIGRVSGADIYWSQQKYNYNKGRGGG